MPIEIIYGLLIPFLGTVLGSACVFFMRKEMSDTLQKSLTGFAAGVMLAASIWSLLIPSMEQSESLGKLSFIPAAAGFWAGILFLLFLDSVVPHMHMNAEEEGLKVNFKKTTKMLLAVTLHNIPEGMAVGVVYGGLVSGNKTITAMGALSLALGIAIQNFPEGAIISMPLRAAGMSKFKAFLAGTLSGIVEPIGGYLAIIAIAKVMAALPYCLSFAAGAMVYVIIEELIPEMSAGHHSNLATLAFSLGFTLMMVLDVALG